MMMMMMMKAYLYRISGSERVKPMVMILLFLLRPLIGQERRQITAAQIHCWLLLFGWCS